MNTKTKTSIAMLEGNEDDGWNVVLDTDECDVTLACESKEDAEDLRGLLNRTSWVSVRRK